MRKIFQRRIKIPWVELRDSAHFLDHLLQNDFLGFDDAQLLLILDLVLLVRKDKLLKLQRNFLRHLEQ